LRKIAESLNPGYDRDMPRVRVLPEGIVWDIVRLQRAEQQCPLIDLATVKGHLEELAGRTIPRAVAARLLCLSQTALDQWVERGDIPVVLTPSGRREVPVPALVDLLDEVDRRREQGADRYPLSSVLRARQARARALNPEELLPPTGEADAHGHRRAELRSLVYHRAVARRLDERLVVEARARLARWREAGRIDHRWADAWDQLLSQPLPEIRRRIAGDDEHGRDLRQTSPLAGVLNLHERRRVLDAVVSAAV
jgi:hypothetical protein